MSYEPKTDGQLRALAERIAQNEDRDWGPELARDVLDLLERLEVSAARQVELAAALREACDGWEGDDGTGSQRDTIAKLRAVAGVVNVARQREIVNLLKLKEQP